MKNRLQNNTTDTFNVLDNTNNSKSLPEYFDENGYLVFNNFISHFECSELVNEQKKLIQKHADNNEFVIFDTQTQQHAQNKHFLDSGRKISFFYEKDAFDSNGNLITTIDKAVNKIGHALHDLNPVFKEFSYQNKLKEILQTIGISSPKLIQSMYMLKQPKIGNKA